MIVLIRWEYMNKQYEKTFDAQTIHNAEVDFKKINDGKIVFSKKSKRKIGFYRAINFNYIYKPASEKRAGFLGKK